MKARVEIYRLANGISKMRTYKGHFSHTKSLLDGWNSSEKGVYYLGTISPQGSLIVYYIGKGCGEQGMRDRLYEHLDRWHDVTHFGYEGGDSDWEIKQHELNEIKKHQPKYNVVGR